MILSSLALVQIIEHKLAGPSIRPYIWALASGTSIIAHVWAISSGPSIMA